MQVTLYQDRLRYFHKNEPERWTLYPDGRIVHSVYDDDRDEYVDSDTDELPAELAALFEWVDKRKRGS